MPKHIAVNTVCPVAPDDLKRKNPNFPIPL